MAAKAANTKIYAVINDPETIPAEFVDEVEVDEFAFDATLMPGKLNGGWTAVYSPT